MLTLEALNTYGANTAEGLARCFNNEAFYLKLVGMGLADANFERLRAAVEAGDGKAAFEAAHALKGVLGNLSLTPLYEPVCQLTERLRGRQDAADEGGLLERIMEQLDRARRL